MNEDVIREGYQTLGKRTYWLFFSKWLETPFAFFVVAIGISIVRRMSLVPVPYQRMAAIMSLVCFGIAVLTFCITFFIARFAYRSQGFSFAQDAFKIRKGIFTKEEIAIPYRQIQNVDIQRTFTQQVAGVSTLIIVTAGSDDDATPHNESKGILQTIDKDIAVILQEELLKRADVQKVINVRR